MEALPVLENIKHDACARIQSLLEGAAYIVLNVRFSMLMKLLGTSKCSVYLEQTPPFL
jgi:hypothetical protein